MRRHWPNFLAVLLLWAFFAQAVTSMVVESPTVDEQAHLMRGYVYLELGDLRFKIGHPILANALNALPLSALADLNLPTDDPAWQESRWGAFSDLFLWGQGNNVDLMFFLSRLVTVALGMLCAALVFRWARQLWDGQSPPPASRDSQSPPLASGGGLGGTHPPPGLSGTANPPPPASGGGWGGLIALALFVFDPTILAHSRYTTDDVAVAFFSFAATYALWRYLETDRPRDLVLAGVAFGLAQGSKFSALLLMPVFGAVVGLWPFLGIPGVGPKSHRARDRFRWLLRHAVGLLAIFAIGGLTVWAGYRFDVGSLPGQSLPLPAVGYFEDLIWEVKYFGREGYAFLCGEISAAGWWYYFLVAFALKSPLPAILLIGAALINLLRVPSPATKGEGERTRRPLQVRNTRARRLMALLLPALAYFLSTLVSPLNIGYRFFIPVLPYLYVLAGRVVTLAKWRRIEGIRWRFLVAGVLVWSGVVALRIHPHYLAYFNVFAGGPDNGWRYLVDSNIDWGQDLPTLHDVVERQDLGRIKLSYFGTAHPSYYGLDFEPLPTWNPTPEKGNPFTRTYYPHDPAPGVYAISATHLQGVVMDPDEWDTYAWFRDKSPFAKAGYSIFLYRVESTGPPVDVALSGFQVDELMPETFAAFGSNDVRLRWFDARTSFVIPSQPGWRAVLGEDEETRFFPKNLVSRGVVQPCTTTAGQTCQLYPPDPAAHAAAVARIEDLSMASHAWRSSILVPSSEYEISMLPLPVNLGDQLQFLGYEPHPHTPTPPHSLFSVLTAWRVTAPPDGRRAIFVHLLALDGRVVAQWDGLDVPVEGWREGDILLQAASFELPADLPPGQYWLQTGVYNPKTMERLPVLVDGDPIADRVLLSPVEVTAQ